MKKIIITLITGALLFAFTGCEFNKDEILDTVGDIQDNVQDAVGGVPDAVEEFNSDLHDTKDELTD